MRVTESLCTSVTRRLVMWLGAAGKKRVSQLHGGVPILLPPHLNAGTVQPLGAPLGSSQVSAGLCCLGPRQSLTGDGSDGGWLTLSAASQAGDADLVAPARFQSRQNVRAGGGWELLAVLGPPWQGQSGVRVGAGRDAGLSASYAYLQPGARTDGTRCCQAPAARSGAGGALRLRPPGSR